MGTEERGCGVDIKGQPELSSDEDGDMEGLF